MQGLLLPRGSASVRNGFAPVSLLKIFGCLWAGLALVALPLPAQVVSGTIVCTVSDQTGAVVPGAAVTAADTETGQSYKTVSDQAGNYTLTNLPNSVYRLTVEHAGFAKAEISRVVVSVSQTTPVHVKL